MTHLPILNDPALAPILAALPQARLVGGCVRDSLAGWPIADIDLATPDTPDRIMAALQAAQIRAIPTGLAHGTITAMSGGRPFEITTLRRDEETDGRHARVAWTTDFTEDAARRDFTINAMSLDRAGTLHDPFGGAADLAAGRVRFVGEAARRIAEDTLRILRFFRFFARYGKDPPDAEAIAAIEAAAPNLARLSAERVWSEIKLILALPDPIPVLRLMTALGVLRIILPEADAGSPRLPALIGHGAPPEPMLRLAAMLQQGANTLASRLKLSGQESERLASLIDGPTPAPEADDGELRRMLADHPAESLTGRVWLAYPEAAALRGRLAAMPRPVFPLEGRHALALGLQPGPQVGAALRQIRQWWLAGGCAASREDCEAQLKSLLEA